MTRIERLQKQALADRIAAYEKAGYAYCEKVLPRVYVLKKSERSKDGLVLFQPIPNATVTCVKSLRDFFAPAQAL